MASGEGERQQLIRPPVDSRTPIHDRLWRYYARVYDLGVRHLLPYQQLQADVAEAVHQYFDRHHPDGSPLQVLDACCGTGNTSVAILRRVPAEILGVDFCEAMLQRARAKCARVPSVGDGRRGRFRSLRADLQSALARLPAGSFDVAVLCNGLYPLADPHRALVGLRRVLRLGGLLVVADPADDAELRQVVRAHLRAAGLDGAWVLPLAALAGLFSARLMAMPEMRFLTVGGARALVEEAGFRVERVSRTYGGVDYLLVCRAVGELGQTAAKGKLGRT